MSKRKGPNLQNIPIRTPEGRRIRDAFDQSPLDLDYGDAERRIFAGLGVSEDSLKGDATTAAAFKARRWTAQTVLYRKAYGGEGEGEGET